MEVLALRIGVSGVLLVVLVSKMHFDTMLPKHSHLSTVAWLRRRAAHGGLRDRPLGLALAAGARRVRQARAGSASSSRTTSPGQFVGNVLPSTIGGDVLRVSRGAKTVAVRAAPRSRRSRSSGSRGFVALPLICFSASSLDRRWSRRSCVDRARDLGGDARRPRRDPVRAGEPAPRGPFRGARELDALHGRGARRCRPPPAPTTRSVGVVIGTRWRTRLSIVLTVLSRSTRSRSRSRSRPSSRSSPRSRWRKCFPLSVGRPRRARGDARRCSSPRSPVCRTARRSESACSGTSSCWS